MNGKSTCPEWDSNPWSKYNEGFKAAPIPAEPNVQLYNEHILTMHTLEVGSNTAYWRQVTLPLSINPSSMWQKVKRSVKATGTLF